MYFKRKIRPSTVILISLVALFLVSSLTQIVLADESISKPALPKADARKPGRAVVVLVTAYSSTPDQTDDTPFITSNGSRVYDGLVAANWLPYGAQARFPELYGSKIFTVNDRMNERYGRGRVDIWMDAPRDIVKSFGVKKVLMEVY